MVLNKTEEKLAARVTRAMKRVNQGCPLKDSLDDVDIHHALALLVRICKEQKA